MASSEHSLWPKHITKFYIDIMMEEVTKGNMNNGMFPSKVWKNMLEKLNSKSQRTYNLGQVKQKFNRLRAQYREFSQLLQHTGFSWNAETNKVSANEEVWNDYIVAHPKASQFRKHGLEHYKILGSVFNRSTVTEVLDYASTQDPPNSDDEVQHDDDDVNFGVHGNLNKDEEDVAPNIVERVTHSGKRRIAFSGRRQKKEPRPMQMVKPTQLWADEASKTVTEAQIPNSYSISACVAVLNEMDLSNDIYVKAMNQFKESVNRELFMAVPLERKRAWLETL